MSSSSSSSSSRSSSSRRRRRRIRSSGRIFIINIGLYTAHGKLKITCQQESAQSIVSNQMFFKVDS